MSKSHRWIFQIGISKSHPQSRTLSSSISASFWDHPAQAFGVCQWNWPVKFTSGSEHLSKTFEGFPACGKFGLDWPNDHCCARHASEMPTAFSFCGSAHLHMPRPEAVPLEMVLNQFIKMSEGSPIKWELALDRKFIPQSTPRPKKGNIIWVCSKAVVNSETSNLTGQRNEDEQCFHTAK